MRPVILFAAFLVALVPGARADTCVPPDVLTVSPPDGAVGVPTNAALRARYAGSAVYGGEDVILEIVGQGELPVEPTFSESEGILSVSAELLPNASHIVHWPGLRDSRDAMAIGQGRDVRFVTTSVPDEMSPSLANLSIVDWNVRKRDDGCTDEPEERYLFDFAIGAANDDFDAS